MTNRLFAVTFDCADAAVVGGFWAQALGQELDPGAGKEFASIGLQDSGRPESRWAFARVPEGKSAKNRMHPDLITGDLEAEVGRLIGLGATQQIIQSADAKPAVAIALDDQPMLAALVGAAVVLAQEIDQQLAGFAG